MANINGRKSLSKQTRFNILFRDDFKCQICGKSKKDDPRVKLEIDHKEAFALGGEETPDNLWTLCFECNRGKGIKTNFNPKDGKKLNEIVKEESNKSLIGIEDLPDLNQQAVVLPSSNGIVVNTRFYAPLSQDDPYKAFVRFFICMVKKDSEFGVTGFYGLSEEDKDWFNEKYGTNDSVLEEYMSKESWDMDLVKENKIKLNLTKIKVTDTLTKAAAYGNAPAVAFLQKETESRTPQTSNTFVIQNAVIQNMMENKKKIILPKKLI